MDLNEAYGIKAAFQLHDVTFILLPPFGGPHPAPSTRAA
jgi:hypothetical protein